MKRGLGARQRMARQRGAGACTNPLRAHMRRLQSRWPMRRPKSLTRCLLSGCCGGRVTRRTSCTALQAGKGKRGPAPSKATSGAADTRCRSGPGSKSRCPPAPPAPPGPLSGLPLSGASPPNFVVGERPPRHHGPLHTGQGTERRLAVLCGALGIWGAHAHLAQPDPT